MVDKDWYDEIMRDIEVKWSIIEDERLDKDLRYYPGGILELVEALVVKIRELDERIEELEKKLGGK